MSFWLDTSICVNSAPRTAVQPICSTTAPLIQWRMRWGNVLRSPLLCPCGEAGAPKQTSQWTSDSGGLLQLLQPAGKQEKGRFQGWGLKGGMTKKKYVVTKKFCRGRQKISRWERWRDQLHAGCLFVGFCDLSDGCTFSQTGVALAEGRRCCNLTR